MRGREWGRGGEGDKGRGGEEEGGEGRGGGERREGVRGGRGRRGIFYLEKTCCIGPSRQ